MKFSIPVETAFTEFEAHFEEVSQALISGEPMALTQASAQLRQSAVQFSGVVKQLSPAELAHPLLRSRLKLLAAGLASRRESLIRRTAQVERALASIVPSTCNTTYSQGSRPYAGTVRQTGAFKVLAA
jgi:hypothetical protein